MWSFWLILILLLGALAALPILQRRRNWGYYPVGVAALALLVVLVLMWFGIIVMSWPWGARAY